MSTGLFAARSQGPQHGQATLRKVGEGNSIARETWLEAALRTIPPGHRIIDAGAGELQYKRFCTHLDYVSQDFGQYDGEGNTVGLQMDHWDNSRLDIVSDICSIPVADNSFDAVMCIEVLEHVPDPVAAIRELDRILRPGGTLVVTAPFCSLTHFAPYHFSTGFSRYFYETHLSDYEILDLAANGNYFEYLAQELRRLDSVSTQYAGQRLGRLTKILISLLNRRLASLSKAGDQSQELLCYGHHVLARKGGGTNLSEKPGTPPAETPLDFPIR